LVKQVGIINGDLEQQDTRDSMTGLAYAIELSKQIEGIEWIKLNHRSDLVGQILTYEYK
jgi:phosphate starvation-inducible protein PhoH